MSRAPLERQLEARLRAGVLKLGGFSEKFVSASAGVPDRLVFWPHGRIDLVELKTDTGRLSAIQEVWHAKAALRGTRVHVVRGADGVADYLREAEEWLRRMDAQARGS